MRRIEWERITMENENNIVYGDAQSIIFNFFQYNSIENNDWPLKYLHQPYFGEEWERKEKCAET